MCVTSTETRVTGSRTSRHHSDGNHQCISELGRDEERASILSLLQCICPTLGHCAAEFRRMAANPTAPTVPVALTPAGGHQQAAAVTALVPKDSSPQEEAELGADGPVSKLPVELDVAVPIRDFRVRNLLALRPGVVVASQWGQAEDLPVMSGNQPLAWSEFEVVDTHLAVRLTRLP